MGFNQLKECHYQQDINVYNGIDQDNLKCKIEIPVPKGMSSDEFDKSVVNTINSFGNEIGEQIPGIKTGFDSEAKPWTSDEQKTAIKNYHEKMCEKSSP